MAGSRRPGEALALLALLLLPAPLRLWLAASVGLSPDEAYYWSWSLELAAGYLDHPPAVAWLVRAGTELAGQGATGIRLPALVLGGLGLPLALYWLGREAGARGWPGLLMPAAAALQPLGLAAGLIITPDVPLLLAWTVASAALLRAVRTGSVACWAVAGAAAGLALLSKHSGWLLLVSCGLGLVLDPAGRPRLRTSGPWLALALALLVASPNLAWDLSRGAPSLGFQLQHGLGPSEPARAPLRLLELTAGQVGLLTPLVAWAALGFLRRGRGPGPAGRLLWVLAAAPLAFFGLAALSAPPEANWPAPAHPLLLAGAVAWLSVDFERAAAAERRRARRWLVAAAATSAAVSLLAALHLVRPLPFLPADREPSARLRGWDDLPGWLSTDATVVADGYELAAALRYHLPGRPAVVDGRRAGLPEGAAALVVAASPGDAEPEAPGFAGRASALERVGHARLRRRDGRVVRTLAGFRPVGCAGASPDAVWKIPQ